MIFDAEFLKRLESLRVAVRRALQARREGDRSGIRKGGSAIFHSYRNYAQGDDFRSIDWSLYARLGSLFIRERTREEAPDLRLVMDTSESMQFGDPTKSDVARKIAAVVGFLVLGEGGHVRLGSRSFSGEGMRHELFSVLENEAMPAPIGELRRVTGKPLVIAISDFWDDGWREALAPVIGSGASINLVHVLSREELVPTTRGIVRFVDSESGIGVSKYVGDEEVAEYDRLVKKECAGWREWSMSREVGYFRCASDEAFEQIVLVLLRGEGLLE